MNKSEYQFLAIPLTHTLLLVTLTTILTIFATVKHYMLLMASLYILLIGYALYKNATSWLTPLLIVITSSLLIMTSINYQYWSYKSDQSFLKTRVIIKGTVEQVNHAALTRNQTSVVVRTKTITSRKSCLSSVKKISIFLPGDHTQQIQESDEITLYETQLEQPSNENDYQRYLIKEGFWAIVHGTKYTQYSIKKMPVPLQQKVLGRLQQKIHKNIASLFDPLFLGKKEKTIESLEIQHKSTYWGIAHHMARSGAHLAILFGLIMLLLHYTQFAHFYRYVLCIFLLVGYALISQSSISFLRALCMILLHIFTKIFGGVPSSLHTLTLTTLIVLFCNPMQLFFLDFQLSFGITYIIIWLFNIKNSKTIAFYKRRLVHF